MKLELKAHPIMILSLMKPFLFVLILPFIKGAVQYILHGEMSGILSLEAVAIGFILLLAFLRWRAIDITLDNETIRVKKGFFISKIAVIKLSKLSSVSISRSVLDLIFSSVTYRINTEAGKVGKADFEIKLYRKDAKRLSAKLYGSNNRLRISYSPMRIAAMAATTSSAFTGLIIGAPVIKKAGDLLGVALSDMILGELNTVSESFNSIFPPAVNAAVLVFMGAYGFAFLVTFLKFLNFRLFIDDRKLEISNGFFVRKKTVFAKRSINDVCIEQRPLMRIFRLYSVNVTVGGYGDNKSEKAVIVPCGRHFDIKRQFEGYFPFLENSGKTLCAEKGSRNLWRSLFAARLAFCGVLLVFGLLIIFFPYFDRLIVFLMLVSAAISIYYANLCIYNYRRGSLQISDNIFARGSIGFGTRELYCEKERLGVIKIIQTPADRRYNTCKVKLTVRSESADSVRVRNLDYDAVRYCITEAFNFTNK